MIAFLKRTPLYRLFLRTRARFRGDEWLRMQLTKRGHSLDKAISEKRPSGIFAAELEYILDEMGRRGLTADDTAKWAWDLVFLSRFGEISGAAEEASFAETAASGGVAAALRARRSVRSWMDAPVDASAAARAVDAARWAPSSCNRQPCLFLALTGKEDKEFTTRFTPQTFFANAPLLIAVLADVQVYEPMESHFAFLDAGAAIENLLLALHAEGLGACWIGVKYKDTFEKNAEAFRARFGHDPRYKLVSFVAAGHPAKEPPAPPRKPLGAVYRIIGED